MKTWEVKHAGRDDADVAKHFKKGEREKLCSLDFHVKKVNCRIRKLGL